MGLHKTIALVSGANRGIGLAIAAGLARRGVHVLLGCRDLRRGMAAADRMLAEGVQLRPVQLDTTDDVSTEALAALVRRDYGRLDILVNNAGIALDADPSLPVAERLQRTLEVNVIGTARLTEAMLPLLAQSKRGRIVNVSSELASFGLRTDPEWEYAKFAMPTYQASKAAVNALTLSYAARLQEQGIKVNAICPGYTATEATNFMGPRTPEQAAVVAINFALLDDEGPTGAFANEAGELPW
ncbi:SDR family oxidoreductase [Rhodovastum atsumiense]|uniref:SDR family oxidoreductase n=1 Tax=Rhodovastum atsumiense TaxID=504468 RepID=A0A5M6IXG9_9PROT|nr:SDR family oxidoreductase [Rhodovastum atsumiense]KAA5612669.1 SDR family oxidoreductase [Rhodovastum atsumiense]CAH2602792.1 SDR family oxidoreductase [Rhodovastum atsumiense]